MDKVIAAFSNPDFWRSLIYIFTALGIAISPEQQQTIITIGFGLSGALHAFTITSNNIKS